MLLESNPFLSTPELLLIPAGVMSPQQQFCVQQPVLAHHLLFNSDPQSNSRHQQQYYDDTHCHTSVDFLAAPNTKISSHQIEAQMGCSQIKTNGTQLPSPFSSAAGQHYCSNCGRLISEREMVKLCTADRFFHLQCAPRCSVCHCPLLPSESDHQKCYERERRLYCPMHYMESFCTSTSCAGCNQTIPPCDLVYKLRPGIVFHVHCHRCAHCGRLLVPGEQIVLDHLSKRVFCSEHLLLRTADSPVQGQVQSGGEGLGFGVSDVGTANGHEQMTSLDHIHPIPPDNSSSSRSSFSPIMAALLMAEKCKNEAQIEQERAPARGIPSFSMFGGPDDERRQTAIDPFRPVTLSPAAGTIDGHLNGAVNQTVRVEVLQEGIVQREEDIVEGTSGNGPQKQHSPSMKSPYPMEAELSSDKMVDNSELMEVVETSGGREKGDEDNSSGSSRRKHKRQRRASGNAKAADASSKGRRSTSTPVLPVPQYPFEMYAAGEQFARQEEESQQRTLGNKRRGPRTTISQQQLEILNSIFTSTPKPSKHARAKLAMDAGLSMRVIQVWFQNRRSKERRLKHLCNFLRHCEGQQQKRRPLKAMDEQMEMARMEEEEEDIGRIDGDDSEDDGGAIGTSEWVEDE